MDTMANQKEKYEKSIEHEAKVIQDYVRALKNFQTQEGEYPSSGYMGMKRPHDTSYNAFLGKIAKQGGFTEADLEEYYNWGRQLNQVKGNIDSNFYPQLLFRYFKKKE